VTGGLPVAQFGTADQQAALLPGVISGELIVTAALVEPFGATMTASEEDGEWTLRGTKTCVPAGPIADWFLVSAATGPGTVGVFVVDAHAPGVTVTPLVTTSGSAEAHLDLDGAGGEPLGPVEDGRDVVEWIVEHATSGQCSMAAGVCKEAVALTAEYAKSREQFDRPIATFQAVAQRAADAYIDAEAVQLTARQAAWRLSEGLPATEAVAIAKFFAAEGGQRVVHAAQHIHGGVGVDRSYPLHRYFLLAKQLELSLGGTTANLLKLGALMAAEPAAV
jgi:alkylation response protein AidB-like acyl-CoA dehydrogenase